MKTDVLWITSVNFSRFVYTGQSIDKSYILASSQAQMVYYIVDEKYKNWNIVVYHKSQDLYDMGHVKDNINYESGPFQLVNFDNFILKRLFSC